MKRSDAVKFYRAIAENSGNPSIKNLIDAGFSEGTAVNLLIRLSSMPLTAAKLKENAVKQLEKMGNA